MFRPRVPRLSRLAYRVAFPEMVRQSAQATTRRRQGTLQPHVRKAVKRIVDADKETFHKTNATNIDVTSTVSFTQLSAISQGDGQSERLGDEIQLQGLRFSSIVVRDDGATVDTYDNLRIVFFIWHPDTANETPDGVLDILESATTPYLSSLIKDKAIRKKFTLVKDMWVGPISTRESNFAEAYRKINFSSKLNANLYFNPAATTGRNHLYMMVVGDKVAGGDNSVMYYDYMLTYKQK